MKKQEQYITRDGLKLYYTELTPDDREAKARVVIVHGLGEHSGRHQELADFLVAHGYAVLLLDQRGFGRSEGFRGHINRFQEYTEDLNDLIQRTSTGKNIFMLGHSLGGLIATAFALSYPETLQGLALSSPALGQKINPPAWKRVLGTVLAHVLPKLQMPTGLPVNKLSKDPQVAANYLADPLCHDKVSTKWYVETMGMMEEVLRRPLEIAVPTLVLQAGEDYLSDADATKFFFEGLSEIKKKLVVYEDAYHEIFREQCGAEARQEVVDWFDSLL